MAASVRYAKSRGAHIAYTAAGTGPPDLLYGTGYTISIDSHDEQPHVARFNRRLESIGRLIRYDARGIGLSDPLDVDDPPTAAARAADALAVLDAAGVDRAVLIGESGWGAIAAMELAATHPERVQSLVLMSAAAKYVQTDDYPYGHPAPVVEAFLARDFDPDEHWELDDSDDLGVMAPSLAGDVRFRDWWSRASHRGASPATARLFVGTSTLSDLRPRVAEIAVPTLVLHPAESLFLPVGLGRYLGENITGAHYVELPGADSLAWGENAAQIGDEIEEFVTGRRSGGGDRVLATVVFTDIVDSTRQAAALGDRAWRSLLESHDAIVRGELGRFGGREVNTTGDGFLASFDSPTQAVRCARSIVLASAAAGISVRVGLHTGECERRGDDLAGLAVHIAARVASIAAGDEVLVSRTVRDLVGGSGLQFADRGEYELKGVPERWQLFALEA